MDKYYLTVEELKSQLEELEKLGYGDRVVSIDTNSGIDSLNRDWSWGEYYDEVLFCDWQESQNLKSINLEESKQCETDTL